MNLKKINIILILGILLLVILSTGCEEIEEEEDFTGDSGYFTDKRDDNTYNWIRIGEQIWMAENLAYNDNTNSISYNSDYSNVEYYGYLYVSSNIEAPEGWHIPDKYEVLQLLNYISNEGYTSVNAYVLKSSIGWGAEFNGVDLYNFRALPSGYAVLNRDGDDYNYHDIGISSNFWTSSTTTGYRGVKKPWLLQMQNNSDIADLNDRTLGLKGAFSIRCIKD